MPDHRASDQTPAPTTPAKPTDSSSRQQRHPDQSKHAPQRPEVHKEDEAGTSPSTLVPPNAK
jgi:hypothetical protein